MICNPNNPTGARLRDGRARRRSAGIASRAWVPGSCPTRSTAAPSAMADETPTVWGRYERAIVTSGLSKAYGLPGLRIGWIVAPPAARARALGRARLHDDRAGRRQRSAGADRARARPPRASARAHARHHPRRTTPSCAAGSIAEPGLTHAPPEAGAIVFVRYHACDPLGGRSPSGCARRPACSWCRATLFEHGRLSADRLRIRPGCIWRRRLDRIGACPRDASARMRADLALDRLRQRRAPLRAAARRTAGLAVARLRSRLPRRGHRDAPSRRDLRAATGVDAADAASDRRVAAVRHAGRGSGRLRDHRRLAASTADAEGRRSKRRSSTSARDSPRSITSARRWRRGCHVVTANKGPAAFAYRGTERARRERRACRSSSKAR